MCVVSSLGKKEESVGIVSDKHMRVYVRDGQLSISSGNAPDEVIRIEDGNQNTLIHNFSLNILGYNTCISQYFLNAFATMV